MKITKHGQSCLHIETQGKSILIDPGIYAFGPENENLFATNYIGVDLIVITHEHQDHFDVEAVVTILEAGRARLLATQAVCEAVQARLKGIGCDLLNGGTVKSIGEIIVTGYDSEHGPLPTGVTPPPVVGVVVDDGSRRLYAPGDTIKLSDEVGDIDIALVPICGEVVMSIEEARVELLKLAPKLAVPYHFDNPRFPVDEKDFLIAMADIEIATKLLHNGEFVEI